MTKEEARQAAVAICELDVETVKKYISEINIVPFSDEEDFLACVHSIRAEGAFSYASKEQAAESKAWLKEHGMTHMLNIIEFNEKRGIVPCALTDMDWS